MKIKQKLYFLALQKFLSLEELIIFLDIHLKEVIEITKKYSREYPNQLKYFDNILINRFVLPAEIIKFIYSNGEEISIDKIVNVFNISKDKLISLLYYLAKKHSKLAMILASNKHFHKELRDLMKYSAINRVKNSDIKLFRNNPLNRDKLISLANNKSIEEISLIFCCSPQIVEDELIFLGIGGYWGNENIRTNSPFFVSNNNNFSKSELIYLIRNIGMKNIDKKLNTTKQNIDKAISIIGKINLAKEDLISFIINEDKVFDGWIYLKELLLLEKNNEQFIQQYTFDDLFCGQELNNIKEKNKIFQNRWNHISDILLKGDQYLFVTTKEQLLGRFLLSNSYFTTLQIKDKTRNINNKDIIFYKKISN